jgi:excisionase family DNA binding protein
MHLAIYTRISAEDRSVLPSRARQEKLCKDWLAERSWTAAAVFSDQKSAFVRAIRPGFEDMLGGVQRGDFEGILVWRLDRLVRSSAEFERVVEHCKAKDVELFSVTESVSITNPFLLAPSRMFAMFAEFEMEVKSIRVKARNMEAAQKGFPPTSGVYGLNDACDEIIESEAAVVREAVARILQGETVSTIARDLSEQGVVSRRGDPFSAERLRRLVLNPSICGDRRYNGVVVAEGCWPAIVSRLEAAEVRHRLASAPRDSGKYGLLAGLVDCGICGTRMAGQRESPTLPAAYVCHDSGRTDENRIHSQWLDEWVGSLVCSRLAMRRGELVKRRRRRDTTQTNAAVRALEREINLIHRLNAAYYLDGEITYYEWCRMRSHLGLQTRRYLAGRTAYAKPRGFPPRVPMWRAGEVWQGLDKATKRNVIDQEIALITIHPAPHRGGTTSSSEDRVTIHWSRDDPTGWAPPASPLPDQKRHTSWWHRGYPSDAIPAAEVLRLRGGPYNHAEAARLLSMTRAQVAYRVESHQLHRSPDSPPGKPRFELEDIDNLLARFAVGEMQGLVRAGRPNPAEALVFTATEVSRLLGVPHDDVVALARDGEIPAMTVGSHVLFPREQLLSWIHNSCRPIGDTATRHPARLPTPHPSPPTVGGDRGQAP